MSLKKKSKKEQKGPPSDVVGTKKSVKLLDQDQEWHLEDFQRFRTLSLPTFEGVGLSEEGRLIDVSERFAEIFGYNTSNLIGKDIIELIEPGCREEVIGKVLEGYGKSFETLCLRKDGTTFPAEVWGKTIPHKERALRVTAVRDITRRKQMQEAIQVSFALLKIANRHQAMDPLLNEFAMEVSKLTGCAAVGIRLLDEEGNIPYQAYVGFSKEFYESETPLSIHAHRCMCINVIKGETSPDLPFYTDGGTFFTNSTSRLLGSVSQEEKGHTRDACNREGYESVALMPIRSGGQILGLIHVADPREDRIFPDWLKVLEGAAMNLGEALQRVRAEESLRKAHNRLEVRVRERTEELLEANKDLTQEIDKHKFTQDRLNKLNRALKTLSACNQMLIHASEEVILITEICRIIVESGGYRLAWVGFARQDPGKNVYPVAQYGYEAGYLDTLKITWGDSERGRGPTGASIRSGKPVIARNIPTDPNFEPWRKEAVKRGYASSISLPLKDSDRVFGALNIYAQEPDAFDPDEVVLLAELAENLSYGISTLRLSRERDQAQRALRNSEKELRLLSSRLLTAEEEERKRISRELHDGIGQSLSAVKFSLESVLQRKGDEGEGPAIELLEAVIPMIRQSIEEVRRISRDLRPSTLDDLGILATLAWFTRDLQSIYTHIYIDKQINIKEEDVPFSLKTVIYRVLQEAMNNVVKHSNADLVQLNLTKEGHRIEMVIEDNGVGFDPWSASFLQGGVRGVGLASMRERTELAGGEFKIESRRGKGTIIKAAWPLSNERE